MTIMNTMQAMGGGGGGGFFIGGGGRPSMGSVHGYVPGPDLEDSIVIL